MAMKRREQALQDYRRLQAKVEKYEEKEKTGPVLAKLHQVARRGVRVGSGTHVTHGSSSFTGGPTWRLWDQDTRCHDTTPVCVRMHTHCFRQGR